MILSDFDILSRVNNYDDYKKVYDERDAKPLIENFQKHFLQSTSYDLRITNKILKFKDDFKIIHLDDPNEIDSAMEIEDISYGYILKSGEYILVQIKEVINMPDDLVAHIRPRTSIIKLGLILSFQHLNPSYSGQLQIGLLNATPNPIEIIPEIMLGQILFEKITSEINLENLYFKKENAKYQDERGFISSKIHEEIDPKVMKRAKEAFDEIMNSLGD